MLLLKMIDQNFDYYEQKKLFIMNGKDFIAYTIFLITLKSVFHQILII